MKRVLGVQGVVIAAALATACGTAGDERRSGGEPVEPPPPAIVADIRADSNRDGEVRFDDSDRDKLTWSATNGAVFLANIDDDSERCSARGTDLELPRCNDAENDVVDGDDDVLDLAPLAVRAWPDAPDGASATIRVSAAARDHVRLFRKSGESPSDYVALEGDEVFPVEDVRSGISLVIEAKDIVRDPEVWDGFVEVALTVTVGEEEASDRVRLRVSPVLTFHHLLPVEEVFVTDNRSPGNAAMRADLSKACAAAEVPEPVRIRDLDPWTQDFFETGYASMPGKGGAQHVMRVSFRSANVYHPGDKKNPLRPAGALVFTSLRGRDSAGVQQFDARHDPQMDSLNSFGNMETIPPYTHAGTTYPFGRILRGATPSFFPDESFTRMMDAQALQPAVEIDTSWLLVGHVDETVSFVKASSPRGWVLLANDARLAKEIFEGAVQSGHGDVPMFVGKSWYDEGGSTKAAEVTVAQALADTDVMSASAEAAAEVDAQVAKLKKETGITDAEIVRVPFLHMSYAGLSVAYQPGMVNGLYAADGHFVAPDPHGPVIDGVDIFKKAMVDALAPHGVQVHFAEDWDDYHAALGEVHCGTNASRKIPDAKWWESGR